MSYFLDGVHAAYAVLGFLLTVAGVTAAGAAVGLAGYVWWTGPGERTAMRVRAWRFVRRHRS